MVLEDGDYVTVRSPGGGGYGDPLRRSPERVADDVRAGYYGPDEARARFGVVLGTDLDVDDDATATLRAS